MSVGRTRKMFSVEDFHRLIEARVISAGVEVELVEGEIYEGDTPTAREEECVRTLIGLLCGGGTTPAALCIQSPVRVGKFTELYPDIALARPREDRYRLGVPRPADIFLVVEVTDGGATFDRDTKVPLYSRCGIGEVWLVDVEAHRVESCRGPTESGYSVRQTFEVGDTITPSAISNLDVRIDLFFGAS